jgi:uroporphyrinogen decarboxylase
MDSKQRVVAAAERRRVDRPATSLRCTAEAWQSLEDHFAANDVGTVLDRLDVDLRWIYVPYVGPAERSTPTLFGEGTDYWGCHMRKIENRYNAYFEFYDPPLAHAETVSDVDAYDWPSLDWWDYSALHSIIEQANAQEPRGILFYGGDTFETCWYLRGLEQFLMDLYLRPDLVQAMAEHVESYYRERALRAVEAARGGIDLVGYGDDLGGQTGMLMNPQVWRRRIKPFTADFLGTFKAMGYKTFFHSCGSIVPIVDDLIDAGLDILEPIQVTAAGMKPQLLFSRFGNRLSFHGAIDEVELLPHASWREVYDETRRTIDVLGRNGGYIVCPSHQVQGDTPVENILAIFQAAKEYRWVD